MNCKKCNFVNERGSIFCESCGEKMKNKNVDKTVLLRFPNQDWLPEDCPQCLKNIPLTSRGRSGK